MVLEKADAKVSVISTEQVGLVLHKSSNPIYMQKGRNGLRINYYAFL